MISLRNSIDSCIDDISLNEFYASVDVCKSLMDVYNKSLMIMEHAPEAVVSSASAQIFGEAGDSIWRKTDKEGNRENIIISLLLLPLRLIQALIKRISRLLDKKSSKALDSKLDELEKISTDSEVINNLGGYTARGQIVIHPATPGLQEYTVRTNISADPGNGRIMIETNTDPDAVSEVGTQIHEDITDRNNHLQGVVSYFDANSEVVIKVIEDGLNSGVLNPMQAKQLLGVTMWKPGMKFNKFGFIEYKDKKNENMDLLGKIEDLCKQYQKSIEKLINAIRSTTPEDAPSAVVNKNNEVIEKLRKNYAAINGIAVCTSDMMQYLEAEISTANQAADIILERAKV